MPFKIVRNDITKMHTEAIVNTANEHPAVGPGCDRAVYMAAGYDELLAYRKENIGHAREGDAFITPGFRLSAKYIIHAVSPLYADGKQGEEDRLRSCYRKSLAIAAEHGVKSIAIPLIATGSFGYPKEEGMRIAADEIHAFLLGHEMEIYLVVFDEKAAQLGGRLYPDLEEYIDYNYVEEKRGEEYGAMPQPRMPMPQRAVPEKSKKKFGGFPKRKRQKEQRLSETVSLGDEAISAPMAVRPPHGENAYLAPMTANLPCEDGAHPEQTANFLGEEDALEKLEKNLAERIKHLSDTFPQYLLYLIKEKGMENAEVYKRAIVDKKVFSKIKNNPDYHPQKMTALCLCVGAKLNLDESKDLLARAGYALSPCDKTDIIFSYFIENGIYDMIELDIQLEEHGLPCIIS